VPTEFTESGIPANLGPGRRTATFWKVSSRLGWRIVAVAALGSLSLAMWRAEVEIIKGWDGLAWLKGYPWTALPICLFVGLSALIALSSKVQVSPGKATAFVASVAGVSWVSFEVARQWFFENPSWLGLAGYSAPLSFWIFSPLLSLVLTSVGISASVRLVAGFITLWAVPLVAIALVLVVPLSLGTIKIVPAHGYTDEIHAVKAGYSMFWVNVVVALAVFLSLQLTARDRRHHLRQDHH
jgi:hypothetical protein